MARKTQHRPHGAIAGPLYGATDGKTPSAGGGVIGILVPLGELSITGYAPTVWAGGNNIINVPCGTLTMRGYAPTVTSGQVRRRRADPSVRALATIEEQNEQIIQIVMALVSSGILEEV